MKFFCVYRSWIKFRMTRRSATYPQMPFTFRTFLIQPPSMPLDTNKARTNVLKQNSAKNRTKLWLSKIGEKSVDRKAHRPALTTERRSRRSRGIFCRKDFCTNYLNTQFLWDFCINFCIYKISSCLVFEKICFVVII